MKQNQTQYIGDKYEIIQQMTPYLKGTQQYLCRNQLDHEQQYISVHLKKSNLRFQNLKVIRIKHFNIFKPIDWYNQEEEFVLIYNKSILEELINTQKQRQQIIRKASKDQNLLQRLVLQLCFVMRELQERGYAWNFLQLSHLYFIDEFVMLDISQFEFNSSPSTLQSFNNFKRNILEKYFPSPFVLELQQCKDYQEITQKAYQMTQITQSAIIEPPFRFLLQYILGTTSQDETVLTNPFANSVVYKIKTPNLYIQQGINTEYIVVKSTKIRGDVEVQRQIRQNIQNELELMEQLSVQGQYFCACIGFYKFWDQVYLLSPFYKKTLEDYFNDIMDDQVPNEQFTISLVLKLSLQFAQALEQLHSFKIVHRDLKPDNLFLTEEQINDPKQQLIIADFDRSKAAYRPEELNHQTNDQFTDQYRPPDDNPNSFSYDIWQFGAICYQLACKGKYPFTRISLVVDDDDQSEYRENALRNNMKQYHNYKDEFVKLLARCLDFNPSKRPSSQELCQIIKEIKNPIQVQVIDIEYSQSYGKNCLSCW